MQAGAQGGRGGGRRFFDIVIVTDLRFAGGTGAAVAEEIAASAEAGYSVAFAAYEAENLTLPLPMNPRLRALLDRGAVVRAAPGEALRCRLAILHNPYVAGLLPARRVGVVADERLLVAHHPPFDALGRPYYDLPKAMAHAAEILDGPVRWAPVGPAVRAQLEGLAAGPELTETDWVNIIDAKGWRRGARAAPAPAPDAPVILGRHSRPDLRKWPASRDEILQVYGDDPRARMRVLGASDELRTVLAPIPRRWELLDFDAEPVARFLQSLDVFVYHHRADWVEAFGYAPLEAMAAGVPCVMAPSFEGLFGDAAVYAPPEDAFETAVALGRDGAAAAALGARAQAMAADRFGHKAHRERVAALIGPPRDAGRSADQNAGQDARQDAPQDATQDAPHDATQDAPQETPRSARGANRAQTAPPRVAAFAAEPAKARVLLFCSNGIGMGHLTRLLSVARRLPPEVEPVFVTMSMAVQPVAEFGYHVEYLPYHEPLGVDIYRWNKCLADELSEMITAYQARALVFDGNSPYQGVVDAAAAHPEAWAIWMRRGLWRPGQGEVFIEREKYFDAVVEPDDLAAGFDRGITVSRRRYARVVDPIRLLDPHEQLSRSAARAELGLPQQGVAVLAQLGSGANYDYNPVRVLSLRTLAAAPDVQTVLADWLIAPQPVDQAAWDSERVHVVRTYPIGRYLNAFDACISAVGYNSFHEASEAGLPTLYVPNENPRQDDQLARARFADRHGFGMCLRAHEASRLRPALARLLDPDERAAMRAAAARFQRKNGAVEAAEIIADLALTRRGERSAEH